jgi:cation diffusion facilitator CzcD-associated flavoprotein CzcO
VGNKVLMAYTASYATSEEILSYLKTVTKEHNLLEYVKLNHRVVGAWWDDMKGTWRVKIQPEQDLENTFFNEADIVINACGVLK